MSGEALAPEASAISAAADTLLEHHSRLTLIPFASLGWPEQRRGWVSGVVRAAEPGGGGLAALGASLVSFALGALEPPPRLAAEHEELVARARCAAAGDAAALDDAL